MRKVGRDCFESLPTFLTRHLSIDWLGRHAHARLTGTGSCVFAKFSRAADAERVAARVPDEWRAFVARGLTESPLLDSLSSWGVAKW